MKIYLDLETNGLGRRYTIIQISAVTEFEEIFDTYVNPNCSLTPECSAITGLYFHKGKLYHETKLVKSIGIIEALNNFVKWINEKALQNQITLVGHNIFGFDLCVLLRALRKFEISPPQIFNVIDTLPVTKFCLKNILKSFKLQDLAEYYSISSTNLHNSLYDAICLKNIILKLMSDPTICLEPALTKYTKPFSFFILKFGFQNE